MSCNYTAFSPAALRNIALHCYGELKCSYWSGLRYWWNSLRFNGHFPSEPQLASVYWSKGWRRCWWQLDYWIYKSCKAPVKSSPPTYIQFFYRPDALPVAQPTMSKHWREKYHIPRKCSPQAHLGGLPTLSLTTNSSWLPLERVAMPLISPLMPVLMKLFPKILDNGDRCW